MRKAFRHWTLLGSFVFVSELYCVGGWAADDAAPKAGDKTVGQVCSTCHGSGLLGAPKIGDSKAWQARLTSAGSIDGLVSSAAHGKGNMPPRGGNSSLSDADLKAAISFMLEKSGIPPP